MNQGRGEANPWYWSYIEDRYMMIDEFSSTCKHDLYLYPLIFPDAYHLYPIHEDGSNNFPMSLLTRQMIIFVLSNARMNICCLAMRSPCGKPSIIMLVRELPFLRRLL